MRPDDTNQPELFENPEGSRGSQSGETAVNHELTEPANSDEGPPRTGRHEAVLTRHEAVARAASKWVKQLVDLTGRNRLLYYRTLKRGTLELSEGDEVAVEALLQGKKMKLSRLLPATDEDPDRLDEALKNARTIHRKARSLYEERGIETLFLAAGLANWTTETTSATPSAPLFMVRIELNPTGSGETDYSVALTGDWMVNDTLALFLRDEYGVELDLDLLLERFEPGGDHRAAFDLFSKQASVVPDITVTDRIVIGTFQYTKLPMVRDLENNLDKLVDSDLVSAIAGDREAQDVIRAQQADVDPSEPNATPPSDEFLVLDADSSQNQAINSILAGESLVIQGPPGTGKSQTIANLISALTARGKRVLFVAEKRAAIDAVTKRLDEVGLSDIIMDLHGGVSSRRELAERLASSLDSIKSVPIADNPDRDYRLVSSRSALVDYAEALHKTREPFGLSLHDAFVRMVDLPTFALEPLSHSQLVDLTSDLMREARENLTEWVHLSAPFRNEATPWVGAQLESCEQAAEAHQAARDLAATAGEAAADLDSILQEVGLPPPDSLDDWDEIFECFRSVRKVTRVAEKSVWDIPTEKLSDLRDSLQPGRRSWLGRAWSTMFDSSYRDAKKQLISHWRDEKKPGGRHLIQLADNAADARERWNEVGGSGMPRMASSLDEHLGQLERLEQRLAALGAYFASAISGRSHRELPEWSSRLASDRINVDRLPRIHSLEEWLTEHYFQSLIEAVDDGSIPDESAVSALDYLWLSSIVTWVSSSEPVISGFDGNLQSLRSAEFAEDDRRHIEDTPTRVRRAVAEHAVQAREQNPEQDQLVQAQARRKRGHLPLRDLFGQAREVLLSLRPCWTMSPLLVSEVLPAEELFDVAIFDEASQVMPADAVPTLMRASQVVVAGDDRQLPPTSFFDTAGTDEDEEEAASLVAGFESVLDVLGAMLRPRTLTWHYRSEDERLIAFSNHSLYERMLITFPGTATDSPLEHVLVRHRPGVHVDTRSSDDEVSTVVDLMIEHAYNRPDETLGVIAMGIYHANRIDAFLRDRLERERDPELDDFFSYQREERAFVKNLERVQGDERDAIILSIGYTKRADGRLMYRFGPLNVEGGERRLNVAVTRARRRLTLVSGFSHTDMEQGRSSARGVELLRSYLKYAEAGGADLGDERREFSLNPFELDVKKRLEQAGLRVIPQYGASGYRIDFAVVHPDQPGELILAVEADGASYHSTPTARDRDRLRQQVLERRGWMFYRIWSTEWFRNHEAETEKVVKAVEAAVRGEASGNPHENPTSTDASVDHPQRSPKPWFRRGQAITEYSHSQLVSIARWIMSDTLLRTKEELVSEMMDTLSFKRRGSRIVAAIDRAATDALRD